VSVYVFNHSNISAVQITITENEYIVKLEIWIIRRC